VREDVSTRRVDARIFRESLYFFYTVAHSAFVTCIASENWEGSQEWGGRRMKTQEEKAKRIGKIEPGDWQNKGKGDGHRNPGGLTYFAIGFGPILPNSFLLTRLSVLVLQAKAGRGRRGVGGKGRRTQEEKAKWIGRIEPGDWQNKGKGDGHRNPGALESVASLQSFFLTSDSH